MMTTVLDPGGAITGFVGVASDPLGAEDRGRIEECVRALAPFWGWVAS